MKTSNYRFITFLLFLLSGFVQGFLILSSGNQNQLSPSMSSRVASIKHDQRQSVGMTIQRSSSHNNNNENEKRKIRQDNNRMTGWWQKQPLIFLAALSLAMNTITFTPVNLPLHSSLNVNIANAFGENIVKELKSSGGSEKYTEKGMDLVETLKKRTEENRAKNDRETMEKSFMNSQAGFYGPFDKFIPVLKANGEYDLVPEEQYKELVKKGKVVGRTYVDGTNDVKNSNTKPDSEI